MITTELAKELIIERLNTKGIKDHRWCREYADDAYRSDVIVIGLLPQPCGEHHEEVYNWGIPVNSICRRHFRRSECLFLDGKVATRLYVATDPEEAGEHVGEVCVSFEYACGTDNGAVYMLDRGFDLTLDELEEKDPEFLKELVFNLK